MQKIDDGGEFYFQIFNFGIYAWQMLVFLFCLENTCCSFSTKAFPVYYPIYNRLMLYYLLQGIKVTQGSNPFNQKSSSFGSFGLGVGQGLGEGSLDRDDFAFSVEMLGSFPREDRSSHGEGEGHS